MLLYVRFLKDHGIGANETILQAASFNSPGYKAFPDGVAKGVFVRNVTDGGPLFGQVCQFRRHYQFVTNAARLTKILKIDHYS